MAGGDTGLFGEVRVVIPSFFLNLLTRRQTMNSLLGQSDPQVFACPKCGEMINTSMAQCAFCNAPVDPQWAMWASNALATVARGFNHANNIMLSARSLIVLLLATFIPGGFVASIGLDILLLAFPVLVVIWF